jgi:hypothetical protein
MSFIFNIGEETENITIFIVNLGKETENITVFVFNIGEETENITVLFNIGNETANITVFYIQYWKGDREQHCLLYSILERRQRTSLLCIQHLRKVPDPYGIRIEQN